MTPICMTCGEPAGVGLEIAQKAWSAQGRQTPFMLLADPRHVPGPFQIVEPSGAFDLAGPLPVWEHRFDGEVTPGKPDPRNAKSVISAIEHAVELVKDGVASSVCTLPINKKALQDGAGFAHPGHTEYLAWLDGKQDHDVVMMLACPELRVVPATIHIALAEVTTALTRDGLERTIGIVEQALRRNFRVAGPRIAVCGLNPHAGEGGAMGREELDWINDCVSDLAAQGLNVTGPWPADTLFHAKARSSYDVAIAMYHDQALIPVKTIDFAGGVNVTLGLDFIRTSPDHGTAFDIAGKGLADPSSTLAALKMAHEMVIARGAV